MATKANSPFLIVLLVLLILFVLLVFFDFLLLLVFSLSSANREFDTDRHACSEQIKSIDSKVGLGLDKQFDAMVQHKVVLITCIHPTHKLMGITTYAST